MPKPGRIPQEQQELSTRSFIISGLTAVVSHAGSVYLPTENNYLQK